ncbi:MAG: cation:proton antiporter [Planctomycetales bacterium]|nr:cation:proton antiporter [Planctomycetales bacterium]MCA9222959.1 cation:proton antiporter [Planctomycetales bacterium]MCA9226092.1 cation:proton antiporter [Planctomycetales bacterium]
MHIAPLLRDLLIILAAGTLSGMVCKRLGISLLVGYLVVGSLIGRGGLGLVGDATHELELFAEAGALLLLFSIGIEFSLDELSKLRRFFFVAGFTQMVLVALPLAAAARWAGLSTNAAWLAGAGGALSSTVLVFRALAEGGQAGSGPGRRGIAILLFQDAALVPLLLLVPLLTGTGTAPTADAYLLLAGKSALFLVGVWLLQRLFARQFVPALAKLRSVELVVLFTISLLGAMCWTAHWLGLPAAIGSLAAGIALSGNRLSHQIDTILLPFRETFAAVFFVTLGMLLEPLKFFEEPLLLTAGLVGVVALKTLAAATALRFVGLSWRAALGMGLGLSQLGEFSFLLVARGVRENLIDVEDYNRMLFIALATLIMTPTFLRWGFRWMGDSETDAGHSEQPWGAAVDEPRALIIGIGPIGRQAASRLELMGVSVNLIDTSPINLHPFAQQGFATFAGDARDPKVLERAGASRTHLAVVCVPVDEVAAEIVRGLRAMNRDLAIIVRCRFQSRIIHLEKAGANKVVSEEAEASGPVIRFCESWLRSIGDPAASAKLKPPNRL